MSIEVTCIECGASHHVNNRLAGRRVRCPSCDTVVLWGVGDGHSWLPSFTGGIFDHALIYTADYAPKPALSGGGCRRCAETTRGTAGSRPPWSRPA